MQNKTVLNFFEDAEGIRLNLFFDWLIEHWNNWDYVVFSNKSCYWLFMISCKYFGWDEKIDKTKILSNDYIMKEYNSDFNNKNIKFALLNDYMHTGYHLFTTYKQIKEWYPNANVKPLVGCLGIRKLKLEQISFEPEKDKKYFDDFKKDVKNMFFVNDENLGESSYRITEMLQELMIQHAVNLPLLVSGSFCSNDYLAELNDNGKEPGMRASQINKEDFNSLIKLDNQWRYNDTSYKMPNKKMIHSGFFTYMGIEFKNTLLSYLLRPIIKCRYEYVEDKVNVIFTPFVMLKSMRTKDVRKTFKVLYEDTDYGKKVLELSLEKSYATMYDGIVYFLSMYLGKKFSVFLKKNYDIDLKQDLSMLSYNYTDEHINIIKQMEKWEEEDYWARVRRIQIDYYIDFDRKFYRNKVDNYNEYPKKSYVLLFDEIIRRKRVAKKLEIYKIKDMINLLYENMYFTSYSDLRDCLVEVLLRMLEFNVLESTLELKGSIITNGFCHGENSDIILPYYNEYLFYAIKLHYYRIKEELPDKSKKTKEQIFSKFFYRYYNFLKRKNYIDIFIDKDEYLQNEKYFCVEWDLMEKLIKNKQFLLQDLDTKRLICREIYDYVMDIDIV